MKIHLHVRTLKLTSQQRAKAELRLGLALGRFGDRVGRVVGRLSSQTTASGDAVARCQIEVDLHPRMVRVAEDDVDLFVAVSRAAERVERSVARALQREHLLEDRPPDLRPAPRRRRPAVSARRIKRAR